MQTANTDCGVACVLTVLNLFNRPGDAVDAVDEMDADRTGSNLEAMRRYMETRHGFAARALAVPANKLGQIGGKLILHIQQMHYVVLLQHGRDGVLVFDPAKGPVYYPIADFAKLYSGYLLEVKRPARGTTLPQKMTALPVVGGQRKGRLSSISLFIVGIAARMLECTILLCIVAALFLVLNRASLSSVLMVFALIGVCGAALLAARYVRLQGEGDWAQDRQIQLWRGLLRTFLGGRDLNGFRGRKERDVAANVRQGMDVSVSQLAQVPAALGSVVGIAGMLFILNPWLALVHLVLFATLLVIMQLDEIQVCRLSIRPGVGRYSKLGLGHGPLNATVASDLFGEIAKWIVIGFAGLSVLLADLSPVALMFWILTGMQIVPLDFRRAKIIAPVLRGRQSVSQLTATEVPLRPQTVIGSVDLKTSRANGMLRIDGIGPLTATLQQPDLTVREQRLILGDVVRHTLSNLAQSKRPDTGPVRIFAAGQEATQSDFEYLMISRETRSTDNLPALSEGRKTILDGEADRLVRDLHSCDPGDFPVFWDFRSQIRLEDLQARLRGAGLTKVGHLTMKRLTVVEVA
ncbi:cysteine peptidase family C39 domain-containing protein [Tateyamaria sp.]|uniref:cysteine peptidase family C39 domain-containing protein n=1 Tax=Tateyamaria sp. TaxID=1929288 RepID=UPI00329F2E0D